MKLRKFEVLMAVPDQDFTYIDATYILNALEEAEGLYHCTIETREVEITEKEFEHVKNN